MKKSFAFTCLFLAALSSKTSIAQVTADTAQGQSPYGVYRVGDIDSVNVVNGNLSLRIPLLSYPQRGKDLRMDFYIYSNDKKWIIGNFKEVLAANGTIFLVRAMEWTCSCLRINPPYGWCIYSPGSGCCIWAGCPNTVIYRRRTSKRICDDYEFLRAVCLGSERCKTLCRRF